MIHAPRGVQQTRRNVVGLEVRIFFEDLLLRFPRRQQFQDIDHPDAHAANTRPTAALLGVDGDALEQVG